MGDSRAYILRGEKLVQVTRDQSLVNQLIEAGQLTEEEAETFEHNNIILQALGTADTVQVDLTHVELRKDDTLMVCSDGLSGMIRADEMREVLLTVPDPLEACKVLTERANLAGGHDNITVIVARFDGDGVQEASAEDKLAYRKYALPEAPSADSTMRAQAVQAEDVETGEVSDEAARESRSLRVGHTMLGMTSPVIGDEDGERRPDKAGVPSTPPPVFDLDEEPVDIPTTGWPPHVVGLTVLGVLLVVAVTGFVFLR